MSTDNLNQEAMDAATAAARAAAEDVKARREAAKAEALRIHQERTADAEAYNLAREANDERHRNSLAVVGEEIDELDAIVNRANGVTPEPQAPPLTPVTPAQPTPAAQDNDSNDDADNPSTRQLPPVPPTDNTPAPNPFNPSNWSGVAWLFALIGAVIGLIAARYTYIPMWENVKNDWHDLLVTLWFVALMAAGFFTGGFIGFNKEQSRRNYTLAA